MQDKQKSSSIVKGYWVNFGNSKTRYEIMDKRIFPDEVTAFDNSARSLVILADPNFVGRKLINVEVV